ncbi:MarR family winged helix-turn-helix transcriptional regulator [Streptomyces sp. FXJ1.172]|uniref:MarR family winged helix-turn-helix transcriptional regulator n=1 Tax=Streptomyces sp. FXJ1.172 TaxID=710705 RepID=UPI0007CFA8BA|nr:MarR family winged helix-turn-helix transcriptional regulator [Streptomyces sp. FXJ1.172]WEO95760.1 MarR family winged helix-turn-helix transcriptional regulator [Streptomyces sp. FXJ1.172]
MTTVPASSPPTARPAVQPVGYWTWAAHQAVVRHLRGALAGIDLTQPQWWVLKDIGAESAPRTRAELQHLLAPHLDAGPEEIGRAIDTLTARAWLTTDEAGRLHATDAGRAATRRAVEVLERVRAEIHDGIPEEEYATTLDVLRRMIRNLGGRTDLYP